MDINKVKIPIEGVLSAASSQQPANSSFEKGSEQSELGNGSLNKCEPKLTVRTQQSYQSLTVEIIKHMGEG